MSQYALVVMVAHPTGSDALPELSSRRPRGEASRYCIAASDEEMARLARLFGLEPELAYLTQEAIPMIEIDAATLAARSLDVTPESLVGGGDADDGAPARVADLEQAIARIQASRGETRTPNAGADIVRAYLERIEEALTDQDQHGERIPAR